MNRVWIDVDGLFKYARSGQRRLGLQRLEFNPCCGRNAFPGSAGCVFVMPGARRHGRTMTLRWRK